MTQLSSIFGLIFIRIHSLFSFLFSNCFQPHLWNSHNSCWDWITYVFIHLISFIFFNTRSTITLNFTLFARSSYSRLLFFLFIPSISNFMLPEHLETKSFILKVILLMDLMLSPSLFGLPSTLYTFEIGSTSFAFKASNFYYCLVSVLPCEVSEWSVSDLSDLIVSV